MTFAIKARIQNSRATTFEFTAQKTMYGGKHIGEDDAVFVFASENDGGRGLLARGVVTSAEAVAMMRGIARQTLRVSLTIRRTALAKRPLGAANSNNTPTGMTGRLRLSSILNSIVRRRTKSSASRTKRRHSSANTSNAGAGNVSVTVLAVSRRGLLQKRFRNEARERDRRADRESSMTRRKSAPLAAGNDGA